MVVDSRHRRLSRLDADASTNGVANGFGLLKDFLQHEVVVPCFFQRRHLEFDGMDFGGDDRVTDGADGQLSRAMHGRHFFVFEVNDVFGVGHNGRGVGTHKEFVVLTHADDERGRFACSNEAVGVTLVNHDQGIRAHNFLERGSNGIRQVQACGELYLLDEVREHFGVGLADQVVAAVGEQVSKGLVVLDDAVVNDCNAPLASGVRVCVHVAGGAVCGPTRVSDAHRAVGFVFPDVGFQVGHFALLLFDTQRVLAF